MFQPVQGKNHIYTESKTAYPRGQLDQIVQFRKISQQKREKMEIQNTEEFSYRSVSTAVVVDAPVSVPEMAI